MDESDQPVVGGIPEQADLGLADRPRRELYVAWMSKLSRRASACAD
jgi:hypothetical protein